jgi:hypothetical protein
MNVPASRRDADVSITSKAPARYPQKNGGAVSKKEGDATFTLWRLFLLSAPFGTGRFWLAGLRNVALTPSEILGSAAGA